VICTAVMDPVPCDAEIFVRAKVLVKMNKSEGNLMSMRFAQIFFAALVWSNALRDVGLGRYLVGHKLERQCSNDQLRVSVAQCQLEDRVDGFYASFYHCRQVPYAGKQLSGAGRLETRPEVQSFS
jgi:hypothetical protein